MTTQPVITLDDAVLQPDEGDTVLRSTARPRPSADPSGDRRRKGGRADHPSDVRLTQLRRFQWAVRAALALGVAASVCANVLHAQHDLIAQTIAAWPPLALMLTVELISRVPVYRRALAVVRLLATACIAGIAAYVSYFHMAAVVSRFGERQPNPYLLPISVDGLIVVASVSLVELAGRVRTIRDEQPDVHRADSSPPVLPPPSVNETESVPLTERAHSNGHARTAPHETPPPPTSVRPPVEPSTAPTATPPPVEPAASGAATTPPLPAPTPPERFEPRDADPAVPPSTAPPSTTTTPPLSMTSPPTEPPPEEPPAVVPEADATDTPDEGRHDPDDRVDPVDPELAALLPAARAARDALRRQRRGLTRDSLAAQLRRDGHTIRTSRVSALLNLLRNDEPATVNGRSPSAPS